MAPARAFSRDRDLIILQQSQLRKEIGGEKRKRKKKNEVKLEVRCLHSVEHGKLWPGF